MNDITRFLFTILFIPLYLVGWLLGLLARPIIIGYQHGSFFVVNLSLEAFNKKVADILDEQTKS